MNAEMMGGITANLQESVRANALLTEVTRKCWGVCMKNYYPKASLSKQEKECLAGCTAKWVDSTDLVYRTTSHYLAQMAANKN